MKKTLAILLMLLMASPALGQGKSKRQRDLDEAASIHETVKALRKRHNGTFIGSNRHRDRLIEKWKETDDPEVKDTIKGIIEAIPPEKSDPLPPPR